MTSVQKWIIFAYFVKKGPKFVSHDSLSGNNEKINYLQKVQKWTIFWPFLTFLPSKWSKNGPFLDFLEIVYFFVISTQGIMGNKLRTLFHKISKNYPLLHEGQFLTFLPSKWSKNGPFLDFLEIVYFFVISTQGIMGNKLRTLFHKISKNYPLLHWSQFLPFLQSKWWKNGLFLHFLEIVYFFVISTQGIMGNKVRTLFHKISKNYPLLHEGQFWWQKSQKLTFVQKWIIFAYFVKKGPNFVSHFYSGNHGKQS